MLKAGDPFERYTVEELLGEGGMGAVYRAFDPRLGRRVALKVLTKTSVAEGEANARLIREARAAAAIDHPNAVSIFDVGEHEGTPYIVMELCEGRTLRHAVGASLPLASRLSQLADVARALAAAHKRGLVHRDIKPENVMVRDDGLVKVLDFGIARRTAGGGVDPHASTLPGAPQSFASQTPALPTLTVEGVKLGTPVYMAPEQIRGDALDGRADQFAWGVLAYELCAGRLPWRGAGDAMAVMASVLTDPVDTAPLARAGVSPDVQAILCRALEKRPEARFASMDDLLRALSAAMKGEPLPAEAAPPEKAPGATEAQTFSTAEVREVLGKALDVQARKQGSTKLGFEDLLAVAAEVGVDPESLREASRALRAKGAPPPPAPAAPATGGIDPVERDAWIRQQKRLFRRHAGVYLIVNAGLLVLGLAILTMTPWWVWFLPGLAWGVGLGIHAMMALTADEDDYREHHQGIQWWQEQRRRRHEERMAAINAAGRRRDRRRVEALPDDQARMRVAVPATDTGRDHAAEEEAAEAEGRGARRRRR